MPCDPVITVVDDVVFFECFSADESSYGCLTINRDDGFGKSEKSREDIVALSGQKYLPIIEMPDGTVYRAESDEMVERIKSGGLS